MNDEFAEWEVVEISWEDKPAEKSAAVFENKGKGWKITLELPDCSWDEIKGRVSVGDRLVSPSKVIERLCGGCSSEFVDAVNVIGRMM